ncbi:MAG TPA: phosphotransferase, partial [Acidimicrobiales bacterium]|nr:phosphotransferase [Acidimicrobiales bacterium]
MTVAPLEELIGPLTAWLSERLRHSDVVVDDVARPPAGQSNDTVLCAVSWQDGGERRRWRLVIRRQATDHSIFRHPDVIREFRVLEGLAGTRVPAPRVLWSEPDPGVLGAPFFAMEHVAGRVP